MKDKTTNHFKITLPAISTNESFCRSVISAFICQLDPTIEELCDIKTAVSEAVTNCIVHAYRTERDESKKKIYITSKYTKENLVTIKIKDTGCGIENIQQAMQPMYTGLPTEERSGMGFSIMQCFCDKIKVSSSKGKGTTVTLQKYINKNAD